MKFGLWLSLVERLPRVQEAVGSNPTSPIKEHQQKAEFRRPTDPVDRMLRNFCARFKIADSPLDRNRHLRKALFIITTS